MNGKYITALVPMKGVSERVKNKNLRNFCGRPLMCIILNILSDIDFINKIVVNTDSEKIKNIALQYKKVIIHDRLESICGNHVPMNSIIEYDISKLNSEYFLQTHTTNPLLSKKSICAAFNRYFDNLDNFDSLLSVTECKQRYYDVNYNPINHNPKVLLNTQDLIPIYEENSCFYFFSKKSFNINKNRIGLHPQFYILPQSESYDIDTEEDFLIAEKIFFERNKKWR